MIVQRIAAFSLAAFLIGMPFFIFLRPANAEAGNAPKADDRIEQFIGTYRREFIGSSGRVVELLDLKPDLTALMTGDYENRGNVVRTGNWTYARSRVIVTFAPIDIGGTPIVLEFSRTGGGWFRSGDDLKLREATPSGFAEEGAVYEQINNG